MTRTQQCPNGTKERPPRLALAGLTGLVAGATRAITDWLLRQLGN